MSEAKFSPEQINYISRNALKELIKKYNASKNTDKTSLTTIFDYLARTPLYFAVNKAESTPDNLRFISLTTEGETFIPIFTGPEEFGKLADTADAVCIEPWEYLRMLSDNGYSAVVNPFGEYFIMWPELIRDMLMPFAVQTHDLAMNKMSVEDLPKS